MNWKVFLAVGAVTGGVFWAARRRVRRDVAEGTLWSDATDSVTRFGEA